MLGLVLPYVSAGVRSFENKPPHIFSKFVEVIAEVLQDAAGCTRHVCIRAIPNTLLNKPEDDVVGAGEEGHSRSSGAIDK